MAAKVTPHVLVAGAILLVALVITVGPLMTGAGSYPIERTDPKVATPAAAVVPATTATEPLVAGIDRMPVDSPFTLRKTGITRGPRIGLPPPPPLDLPVPPLLPLPIAGQADAP